MRFLKRNWGILIFMLFTAIRLAMPEIFAFKPLSWQAWTVFAILTITYGLSTAVFMMFGITLMLLLDIVTPACGIDGFASTVIMSVAILFIVAEGIQQTSVLLPLFRVVLSTPRIVWEVQLRVMHSHPRWGPTHKA